MKIWSVMFVFAVVFGMVGFGNSWVVSSYNFNEDAYGSNLGRVVFHDGSGYDYFRGVGGKPHQVNLRRDYVPVFHTSPSQISLQLDTDFYLRRGLVTNGKPAQKHFVHNFEESDRYSKYYINY